MKTIFKKIGLSLAAFVCAISAGVGVALTVPQTTAADAATVTLEDRDFYISGTGVRLVNDKNGAGLRFHTNLLASEYASVEESGTLIIPEFRYDGELTLDDLNKDAKNRPTQIVTMGTVNGVKVNYWRDITVDGEAFKRATVYLHDIPEVGYGTRMVVVSYVKIGGEYIYTSVINGSNYISLSTAATMAINATDDAALEARLEAFVVDSVKVNFVMPDGTKTTETVTYGEKLTMPQFTYDEKWFDFEGWKDQYGNVWDTEFNIASYPVTLTPSLTLTEWKQIATKVLGDGYSSSASDADKVKRAWVNYGTPEVLTTGVPTGFNVLNKFTWYKESTSMWKAGGNPFYRSVYDQTDISVYDAVRFGLKVETVGDAYIRLANSKNVTNEWLFFELIQTSANVWTLNVYDEAGSLVYNKEGVTRSISGLNDRDSIASLIFSAGNTNNANLYPASTTENDVYVYTTDILGLRDDQAPVHPSATTTVVWEHIWNNYYFEGGTSPLGAWSDMEAPSGFTKVTEYSWNNQKDFPKTGNLNNTTNVLSQYSDVYFAMKVENGTGIYVQGGVTYYGDDWLYVHLYQAEDGTWSKDFVSEDGYNCFGKQTGLTGTNLAALMQWKSGVNTGSYPINESYATSTATAYFTEVRGILKDGATVEINAMDIPDNAVTARAYIWRDDLYTDGTNSWSYESDLEPEGFNAVLTHTWKSARTTEYTYCFDDTLDISLYSDLYFAMKLENGSHIYVKNSSGDHYRGTDWLYAHYSKNADGTWTMYVESPDGYKAYSKQTYTATTLKGLTDGYLYAVRTDTSVTTTAYYTEVLGVLEEENAAWGERAVWSTIDKAEVDDELAYGMPTGFTSLYKKENFTMNDLTDLDLSDGYYDQIRFGIIADNDFIFNKGYGHILDGETEERPVTTIMSKLSNKPSRATMNFFTLTNLGGGNWTVEIKARLWCQAKADGSVGSKQVVGTFTYNVSGNNIREIISTILKANSGTTAYCTEARGTHTCKIGYSASLGNGYIQNYCLCGLTMGEPVAFAHGIPAEATTILPSIWRADNYALSASTTMEVPVGFTNVKEYNWLHNTANGGNPWGAGSTDMSTYCYNETDITGYSDLYFAIRIIGGKDICMRGMAAYEGSDWLYVHYQQTGDGLWTLTARSVDGYEQTKPNVKGTTLKALMEWNSDASTNAGFFPRRNADDAAPMVYFTDVRATTNHEHAVASYASNGDATHSALCSCGEALETASCDGGTATCTLPSICAVCNTAYGVALGHYDLTWVNGEYICGECGEATQSAQVLPSPMTTVSTSQVDVIEDCSSIAKADGFNNVYGITGGTKWTSSSLGSHNNDASINLSVYSDVWFAFKLYNARLVFISLGKADIAAGTNGTEWIYFHLTQNEDATWDIEVTYNNSVYVTAKNQVGSTVRTLLYDNGYSSTDGGSFVIYQYSGTPCSVYTTEMLGAFKGIVPEYSATVAEHAWNPAYFVGGSSAKGIVWSEEAAPLGFTKVTEYTWSGAPDFPHTGCLSNADISAYSDLYLALKVKNGNRIYIQGSSSYTGGDWLYVHFYQAEDGTWSKDFYSADGYSLTGIQTGLAFNTLATLMQYLSGTNRGSYPTMDGSSTPATAYFTELRGVLKCDGANHSEAAYLSNGDGTHTVSCSCGETLSTVACSGGEEICGRQKVCADCGAGYGELIAHTGGTASCTEKAVCTNCGAAYGALLDHSGVWEGEDYVCDGCGKNLGGVDTELDKQTVALFTNATSITANQATTATVDLSAVTALPISSVKSVALDSVDYTATISGKKISFDVLPKAVYGEYVATATVVVEGKEFEITVPVLVVTNMITTKEGVMDMKYVLRGKTDVVKVVDTSAQDENELIYKGGEGGDATMHGKGYYMLGGDVTLTADTGGHTDVYVWGTKTVPFVGIFDGNGYTIHNFVKTNWFNDHTLEDYAVTGSYAKELEGSFFGYVNGTIRNVAFTGVQLGIYANLAIDGTGIFEDVYVEIADMQQNVNLYVAPFFWRNSASVHGVLRNVVVNLKNMNSAILSGATNTAETDSLNTRYPALTKCTTAENVAVYGFNKSYISVKSGRGNVYYDGSAFIDGSAAGIRAEYSDGTNNGALFSYANLDSKLWKMVDGIPYLIKMSVSGTATAPGETSPSQNKDELDGYITNNGTTQYYIAWDAGSGATRAARFINDTMKASTGASLSVGGVDVDNLWKKQIVLGSFANYGDKIDGLDMSVLSDDSYGLYLVEKTIFILAESDAAFDMAAEEFCRRIFGWTEISPDEFVYNTEATVAIPASLNYTTEITFDVRSAAFTKLNEEKTTMNFSMQSPYTSYKDMHNALDYFDNYTGDMTNMLNVNTEMDEKGSNNEVHGEQLCYTARGNKTSFDAMLGQVVSEIVAYAQERPTMTATNFMIEDDPDYCGCDTCKQFSNPSILQLVFLNELSYALAHNEYLLSQGRTIAVEFFAYSSFYHAPILTASDITALNNLKSTLGLKAENATITTNYKQLNTAGATYAAANDTTSFTLLKAVDNLRLYWTSHKASHSYALTHEANDHMYLPLLAWSACVGAENIDIFMYQTSFWDLQLPLNTWEYQIVWYQELDALGIGSYMFNLGNTYNPAESQTAFSAFKAYIDSRAMTDLNVTFEQLKDEFFSTNGYYGAAGPQMRVFFEELVSAMERKKQDGSASILSDNADTTSEYIDASQFRYYGLDADGNPVKSSDTTTTVVKPATPYYWRIQAFFNGVYGLSEGSLLFKQEDGTHNKVTGIGTATTANITLEKAAHTYNLYVYGNKTQLETLKTWQQYCVNALNTSGLTAEQIKRVKAEAVFPEYAMLLLYTDYTVTFKRASSEDTTWTRQSGVTCALQSGVASITSVSGNTLTYQSLYNLMKTDLGFETPSEQYGYNSVSKTGKTITIGAGWMNMEYEDSDGGFLGWGSSTETIGLTLGDALYHSAFMNWGVTL